MNAPFPYLPSPSSIIKVRDENGIPLSGIRIDRDWMAHHDRFEMYTLDGTGDEYKITNDDGTVSFEEVARRPARGKGVYSHWGSILESHRGNYSITNFIVQVPKGYKLILKEPRFHPLYATSDTYYMDTEIKARLQPNIGVGGADVRISIQIGKPMFPDAVYDKLEEFEYELVLSKT